MNVMGNASAPHMSPALRRAQRWYPPAMVAAGLIMAVGIMPWGGAPAGQHWLPLLGSAALLIVLAWWMTRQRVIPKSGGAYLSGSVLGFMVLRLPVSMAAEAWGTTPWLGVVGALICAVPFFVVAWVVARRWRRSARTPSEASA
jgi:hypothetical protein